MPKNRIPFTSIKKPGNHCRLFGKDFVSMSEAARHFDISLSWVREMVAKGINEDCDREDVRKHWKKSHSTLKKDKNYQDKPIQALEV